MRQVAANLFNKLVIGSAASTDYLKSWQSPLDIEEGPDLAWSVVGTC